MRKIILLPLLIAISFCFGFSFRAILASQPSISMETKKVTGIGGIFFTCKDPKAIAEWYKVHLGFDTGPYGTSFKWREMHDSTKIGLTQWNPFAENTTYFKPSAKDFMINYRVMNLRDLVVQLHTEGVTILDSVESYDFGQFVHILDPEGNKIELWEPAE